MLLAILCGILLQTIRGLLPNSDLTHIANANHLRKEAQKAVDNKNYTAAITHYNYLLDTLRVADDAASLNVAHALLKEKKTEEAQQAYTKATQATKNTVRSTAYTQLGVLATEKQQEKEALQYFKQALKENPRNEYARYNYELLKRKMQQPQNNQDNKNQQKNQDNKEQQQDKDQQNKGEQQQKDGQNKEQQNKEQEGKDKEEQKQQDKDQQNKDGKEREEQKPKEQEKQEQEGKDGKKREKEKPQANKQALEKINMSEEKAQMILEAMKNNEVQYIQQRQHKAKKRSERNKPDW